LSSEEGVGVRLSWTTFIFERFALPMFLEGSVIGYAVQKIHFDIILFVRLHLGVTLGGGEGGRAPVFISFTPAYMLVDKS